MFQDVIGPTSGKKALRIDDETPRIEVFVGHGKAKIVEVISLAAYFEAWKAKQNPPIAN